MSENFYTILTATGKAKLANSAVLGSKVNFKTLKVGDGNGSYYEPTESQTSLVREVWSGNVSSISVDENNPNWIVAETLIPATIGGFFIREAGIFDEDGDLIAISKLSETYKPVVSEGSIKDLCIKIVLEVSNVSSVTLKIDPTVIVATRKDIDILQAKMDASNAQTAEEIKELDSKLSEQISELANKISNKTVVTPAIGYGMNNVIKNVGETSVSPKFTIQGKTVINLLGKDGNCEDVSKWQTYQVTPSLDSTNKVFGSNGIKLTVASLPSGLISKTLSSLNIDVSKYYLISAYVKNGNATGGINILKNSVAANPVNYLPSQTITSTSSFTRIGIVVKPSDLSTPSMFGVEVFGAVGQYAYVDGIMLTEVTADEYAQGASALLDKYPYVDSYSCLQNPYIEVRHDNLIRNGNGEEGIAWWINNAGDRASLSITNGKMRVNSTSGTVWYYQKCSVKPNTNYYLSGNVATDGTTTAKLGVFNMEFSAMFALNGNFFNTGSCTELAVLLEVLSPGYADYDSIMLVEGTTAPNVYKSCRIERCIVEGKFANGDSLVLENGEVTGQINWKHKTLYGKDYDWQFLDDFTGGKRLVMSNPPYIVRPIDNNDMSKVIGVKYDGKILTTKYDTYTINDCVNHTGVGITAPDSDTGWAESINPNNDEVKAFMNGWKAIYQDSVRYTCWESVVDKTPCPAHIFSTISSSGSGAVVAVANASKFAVGDAVALYNSNTGLIYDSTAIDAMSGNNITLHQGTSWTAGDYIVKQDTSILNYCKNNVAPGYEGYQLHYKLQNPEPLTDVNTHIHGDVPKFDVGENYLYLDSGIVFGEVVNPINPGNGYYYINQPKYAIGSGVRNQNPIENINSVYKNLIFDTVWAFGSGINTNGKISAYTSVANFDTSATYTVDYKILATQSPQIGTLACSYVYDIISVLNKVQDEVNNKQNKDSILDQVVDLSIYEKQSLKWFVPTPYITPYEVVICAYIPITRKKTKPIISLDGVSIYSTGIGGDITAKFSLEGILLFDNLVKVSYITHDSNIITNAKNYGIQFSNINITADCRGRI
ncbi:phage tail protein [Clostridium sp. YIM B02555]|uniref:phage tail protein n=1 Tax=Clostridium sp. YIM B02555 TaxID=2911968 RepID=UPI001EEF4F5D|nr:phage tail protein [Clostridium sp. YIM B02555]